MECATSGALDAKESAESAAQAGLAAAERVAATEAPINVRRFMGGILPLWEGKGTGVQKKEGRSDWVGPPSGFRDVRTGSASQTACGEPHVHRWHAGSPNC